jgi:diguanylate cyclase (GGDEF)-like protein
LRDRRRQARAAQEAEEAEGGEALSREPPRFQPARGYNPRLSGGSAPISIDRPQLATAGEAIRSVSRLLAAASGPGGQRAVERALTEELRAFTGASEALLFEVDEAAGSVRVAVADPDHDDRAAGAPAIPLARVPAIADALTAELAIRLDGEEVRRLDAAIELPAPALLLPMRAPGAPHAYVLALAGGALGALSVQDVEAAAALLTAVGTSVGQAAQLEYGAREADRHSALARAAKALNESLDLSRVLPRICEEAAAILDADAVAVYRGGAGRGLVLEAAHPAAEGVGARVDAGAGIAGSAIELGRPLLARDIDEESPAPAAAESPPREIRSALAVPMRWDGEARGVLWAGFHRPSAATERDLALLESFAELAAVACRNASVHAGLAKAARTDGLTGCLNHAALHETLRREMQRSRRTGRRLSIVLVDLDHFKQVNELHGHLVGDEVLRRVGRALREAVRPYDFVARYGGDEFAIVAVDAHEDRAAEIGERSIARLRAGIEELLGDSTGTHATAGVAQWKGDASPADLVREADRALLYGKQQGIRGRAVLASDVPAAFTLGRPFGEEDGRPQAATATGANWPSAVREETEPLRKRTRQLALANAFGARIAALAHVEEIVEVAAEELPETFGFVLLPGERGSELAAAIHVGSEPWGVLDVQEEVRGTFTQADARLLETVADQLASALRSATDYEQLERAYLATAEALGSALESKDAHTAEHARSIVRNAEAVGRTLGMSSDDLRDLRYAAAFHDIGKIAVPERILNKPGPLTESERREVERHAEAGAEILSEVDFLEGVLPLVRHCHEQWDGRGYPDGLAGDRIPLGARVILVCDAHDAMTADRPYRRALAPEQARDEIRLAAGRQFDSRVAKAFLEAVGRHS